MPCFPSGELGRAAETHCEMLVYVMQTKLLIWKRVARDPGSSFLPSFPPNLLFIAVGAISHLVSPFLSPPPSFQHNFQLQTYTLGLIKRQKRKIYHK